MKKKNEGFSLVELIIVIAIMAILVGVMAPQLIKYIEKTKISADIQFCDTVHTAMLVALSDPDVVASTSAQDINIRNQLTSAGNDYRIDGYGPTYEQCEFGKTVIETVGVNIFDFNETKSCYKSKPAHMNGILCYRVNSAGTDFTIYIAHSDKTGQGRDINPAHGPLGDVISTE